MLEFRGTRIAGRDVPHPGPPDRLQPFGSAMRFPAVTTRFASGSAAVVRVPRTVPSGSDRASPRLRFQRKIASRLER